MRTIEISQEDMARRISRFSLLKPLPIQADDEVPQEARDIVYARKLLSVIGLEDAAETPISANAPIIGAAGMTMTMAVCPPGQGPSLHAHLKTYETFTVLKGKFEIRWNDDGSESATLTEFDTVSVPPRVNREFRNIGDGEGILQVVITGGVHDMNDIDFSINVVDKLKQYGPAVRESFEEKGLTFTAHKDAVD